MLYITTRNKTDSYTPQRVLQTEFRMDGGQFLPMNLPTFSDQQINALRDQSFGQTVAQILNCFFSVELNGCDIDFGIGRYPFQLKNLGSKVYVAEVWHNLSGSYDLFVRRIYSMLCVEPSEATEPNGWVRIAVRIAFLFGLYGELSKADVGQLDVACECGDFELPAAAWYAKKMGLPVNTIICGCDENGTAWDIFHKGQFHTSNASDEELSIKKHYFGIECLIFSTLGMGETLRYVQAGESNSPYSLYEEFLERLNQGFFAAVIGPERIPAVINSVYRNNTYLIDPRMAISYGAVQDYRARSGENRTTLLFAEASPLEHSAYIGSAVGLSETEMKKIVH